MPDTAAPSTNILDRALATLAATDPVLAAEARREVEAIREGRSFGLVFNRHLPESVRLPLHPIKRGVKVALRNPSAASKAEKDATWRVVRVEKVDGGRVAHLVPATDEMPTSEPRPVDDLVVIREFGEPVYPGLRSLKRIERGGDAPFHTVINGENFHALQALRMTHRGKVDLIYIDPPYNTGNQGWIYNDKYVDVSRGDASSKWLSFMERRLAIARELLKDTGVIIVAIGDDEHHRLRMLMDQVFGAQNFLADAVWQGIGQNNARYTAGGVDYMVFYARNEPSLSERDVRWKESKPGIELALNAAAVAWSESGGEATTATRIYRAALRDLRSRLDPAVFRYDSIDERGDVFQATALTSPKDRPNLKYSVLHPVTGRAVRTPEKGWRYSQSEMERLVADGKVIFGSDESIMPRFKRLLEEQSEQSPYPTFTQNRMPASKRLSEVLGDDRFPYPKDHEVLMRWFRMVAPKDAVILDFFGGSGTTAEAVMRLNAEDGGTRQAILVTNNELGVKDAKRLTKEGYAPGDPEWEARGVFEYVTRPRIETVVTGVRPDGSVYSDGLEANVEFFEMTYLDETRVTRAREFEAIAPLLWMQAGAVGARISTEDDRGWSVGDTYAVLHSEDGTGPFLKALAAQMKGDWVPSHVFVVTDSESHFAHVAGQLPRDVNVVRLYEAYLRNFEINVEVGS